AARPGSRGELHVWHGVAAFFNGASREGGYAFCLGVRQVDGLPPTLGKLRARRYFSDGSSSSRNAEPPPARISQYLPRRVYSRSASQAGFRIPLICRTLRKPTMGAQTLEHGLGWAYLQKRPRLTCYDFDSRSWS